MCREAGLLPVWLVPSLPVLPDELCRPAAGFPPPDPTPDVGTEEEPAVDVDEELAAEELAVAEEEALLLELKHP